MAQAPSRARAPTRRTALPMSRFRVALLVAAVAACSEATSAPVASRGGLFFVAGNGSADTISSELSRALIVDVRDSLGFVPRAGTVVRFTGVPLVINGV